MTTEFVLQIAKEGLYIAFIMALPVLVAGMVIGVLISVFQAVTQIQDQSISFVPKIIASFAALVIAGPWMIDKILNYTIKILGNLKYFIR
jgi:flagellar biosynthesis protein FliQ